MNKVKMIEAGINYDEGVRRFAGKEELYKKYVLRFPDDQEFEKLKYALEQGDVQTAFRSAHTMKGTTGNLSFNRFMDTLVPLVEALRSSDLEKGRALFPAVEEEYHKVIQVITE